MDDDVSRLRSELRALQIRLAALEAATVAERTTGPVAPPEPAREASRLSRRGLLAAAVAGGASVVAGAVTTAAPAAAAPAAPPQGNAVQIGINNQAAGYVTIITSDTGANASPFGVVNPDSGANSIGVYCSLGGPSTMFGDGGSRGAVIGDTLNATGVAGLSRYGTGIAGITLAGTGVSAVSSSGNAINAQSSGSQAAIVSSAGDGFGVYANSLNNTAVYARSQNGYGVVAEGYFAPLRIVPVGVKGKPTTGAHLVGELYVDKAGSLFYCSRSGTPGTWVRVVAAPSA